MALRSLIVKVRKQVIRKIIQKVFYEESTIINSELAIYKKMFYIIDREKHNE